MMQLSRGQIAVGLCLVALVAVLVAIWLLFFRAAPYKPAAPDTIIQATPGAAVAQNADVTPAATEAAPAPSAADATATAGATLEAAQAAPGASGEIKAVSGYIPDRIADHTDIAQIDAFLEANPQIVQAIAGDSWMFAHASVGENMLSGMQSLRRKNSKIFPLTASKASDSPPKTIKPGVIYQIPRGNPGVDQKLSLYDGYMTQTGWGGKVSAAMNKFCYIDFPRFNAALSPEDNRAAAEAMANDYIARTVTLETLFPETRQVYITMPLTVENTEPGLMRNFYNDVVRQYCRQNNLFLLDIADIQSHTQSGDFVVSNSMTKTDGSPVELLFSEYTNDGGHMDDEGQARLARGWYAMAAALHTANQ